MNTNNINITKQGLCIAEDFIEPGADSIFDTTLSYTFTPAKDTNNSCFNTWVIDFSDYISTTTNLIFRITANVTYSSFDSSSTAGTFRIYWQGDNYVTANAGWAWQGTNYVTSALNSKQPLTSLVNGTSGSYTYNTIFTIPTTWLQTYSKSRLGIRSNYSNGTGNITISNIVVTLDKNYCNGNLKINDENIIATNNIIEY